MLKLFQRAGWAVFVWSEGQRQENSALLRSGIVGEDALRLPNLNLIV
jgi:hypothetical protein